MKIVFITNLPSHYHIKVFETIAQSYNVDFLFSSEATDSWIEKKNNLQFGKFNGEYIYGLKINKKFSINFKLMKKLLHNKYDIIIQSISGRFEILASFIIAKIQRKPFILWTNLWFHPNTLFHKISFPVTKYIYKKSDALVVYGNHVKDYLMNFGVDENKIFYSWNVIDNDLFNGKVNEEEIAEIKEKYNLNYQYILLFVGRHSEEKGLIYLLDAVKLLPKDLSVGLILIGEGKEKGKVINYSNSIGLKNVLFLNYISNADLIKYYALADIFILPSITTKTFKEPWGVVINEAMNQSCPVIASNAVGAAMGGLVQEEKNGIIFPEKDVVALSNAIASLLCDPEKLKQMRQFTYNEIQKWDHIKSFNGFDQAIKFVMKKSV